jgi:hypothetical protein
LSLSLFSIQNSPLHRLINTALQQQIQPNQTQTNQINIASPTSSKQHCPISSTSRIKTCAIKTHSTTGCVVVRLRARYYPAGREGIRVTLRQVLISKSTRKTLGSDSAIFTNRRHPDAALGFTLEHEGRMERGVVFWYGVAGSIGNSVVKGLQIKLETEWKVCDKRLQAELCEAKLQRSVTSDVL